MTTLAAEPVQALPARDPYRFGDGPTPVLQVGTIGWSIADVEDPAIYPLWAAGRHEILDGVLAVMPPALFYGGSAADNLKFILRSHLRDRRVRCVTSAEVDIRVEDDRIVRADAVAIWGDDLPRFDALRFPPPRTDWRQHTLTIPPTLVIEAVSQGHEDHDRETKRAWYAGLGVPHYWLVDGLVRTLDCLSLGDGLYHDDGAGRGDDIVRPASLPGLTIPLAEVWDAAPPG